MSFLSRWQGEKRSGAAENTTQLDFYDMKLDTAGLGHNMCATLRVNMLDYLTPKVALPLLLQAENETTKELSLSGSISARFSRDLAHLAADWAAAAPAGDLFLQVPFLQAMADCPPKGMSFGYLVFYRAGQPVGVALLQCLPFSASDSFQEGEGEVASGTLRAWAQYTQKIIARRLRFDALICGNMLLTGHHGFYFNTDLIPLSEGLEALEAAIQHHLKTKQLQADAILWKDMSPSVKPAAAPLLRAGYQPATFQPSMILDLAQDWRSFEDYLAAMTSKYRVRTRRTLKKAADLTCRPLSLADIIEQQDQLHQLYLQVTQRAEFNAITLHKGYFAALKQTFGEAFQLWGYYDTSGTLLGFCTTLSNGEEMEAHFLGFDMAANQEYHLYHNMLYQMVRQALATPSTRRVIFARTAEEIKSSVGALPHELHSYFYHRNPIIHAAAPKLMYCLAPPATWVMRHPFSHQEA